MPARFSLKDQLFNADTIGQLAGEYAAALPGFNAARFQREAMAGLPERELLARLDWIADCIDVQLSRDFNAMADELEVAMPPPLDPDLTDNDFGRFIHAIPGILAVRHGLENHRARAMDLLYRATQRFSMEFYIRPFLNRWPEQTLNTLKDWAEDDNYHVRRLVSEGTRPRLPWARAVDLRPEQTLPLLDRLHGDPTRYVTRSVANHLNDLSKTTPEEVLQRLSQWQHAGRQHKKELAWMTRHALRTLVKQGDADAMAALGYRAESSLEVTLDLETPHLSIGEVLTFSCRLGASTDLPVLVDYRIEFARPDGRTASKVFKLKQGIARPGRPFEAKKQHRIKGDATTFRWYPGPHRLVLQVNGHDQAEAVFLLA